MSDEAPERGETWAGITSLPDRALWGVVHTLATKEWTGVCATFDEAAWIRVVQSCAKLMDETPDAMAKSRQFSNHKHVRAAASLLEKALQTEKLFAAKAK